MLERGQTGGDPIRNRIFRVILWCTVIVASGAAVVLALRPQPILVDVAVVQRGPMQVEVEEDGQTRIRDKYVVSTPLKGRILRVTLEVGDEVKADETVLTKMEATDPTLLDPRAVAQAKSSVGAAERKLQAAKAELTRLESMLQFAEREMGRVRELVAKNAASDLEFSERELLFRQRTEEVRAAGFAVDIAEYELELAQAALLLTDPEQQDNAEMELAIKAPINGRILRIHQESSAVVEAGAALMEIGDPTDLEVVSDVLSRDAVKIAPGNPVRLQRWGGEKPLAGRVRLVEPSGFTKLSALGVEEQRVNVIIDFMDPPEKRRELGDGFRVECEIVIWEDQQVLQVPTSAIFRSQDQWQVFLVNDSNAHLQNVEIGKNNGRFAQVLDGLKEGDRVVTHPGDSLQDGVDVSER